MTRLDRIERECLKRGGGIVVSVPISLGALNYFLLGCFGKEKENSREGGWG